MQAFEVRDFRLVAGGDQLLEAGADQGGGAAAEHDLLAEEVGLRLLGERRFDHSGAGAADALRVGQGVGQGATAGVVLDRDEARRAGALGEHLPHPVPRRLRRDQGHVDFLRRSDLAVADVEPVREHQGVPRLEIRGEVLLVEFGLHRVGRQDHDHLRPRGRGRVAEHLEAVGFGLGGAAAAFTQADDDVDAAVAQVQRVGVSLAAVADHRDGAAVEPGEVRVVVVIELRHLVGFLVW